MTKHELRDKDHVILQQLEQGNDDVQKITAATTLENHHVTYAFEKLENQGLIQVSKPGGMTTRIINGQKRVFQHPKQAELTNKGKEYLKEAEQREVDQYEDLSHQELVEKVHQLENEITDLKRSFQILKDQIQKKL